MIRSMTGFGSAAADAGDAHFSVEIRSVNNRYFKAQVRLPEELQELEAELEAAISGKLSRGSVVATVRHVDRSADAAAQINTRALASYLEQLLEVDGLAHDSARIDLGALLALPGVIVADAGEARLERARATLGPLVVEACDNVIAMRVREGQTLHDDLHTHASAIREHLAVIAERAPEVVELYQQRLRQRMQQLLSEAGSSVREEDVLREVAVFAERSDIAEEISRLSGHLDQFEEIVAPDRDEPSGRTLDFLSQEMLREANTIGSKCLDVEIARRIVEVKGAIDRIKEQAQNVE